MFDKKYMMETFGATQSQADTTAHFFETPLGGATLWNWHDYINGVVILSRPLTPTLMELIEINSKGFSSSKGNFHVNEIYKD